MVKKFWLWTQTWKRFSVSGNQTWKCFSMSVYHWSQSCNADLVKDARCRWEQNRSTLWLFSGEPVLCPCGQWCVVLEQRNSDRKYLGFCCYFFNIRQSINIIVCLTGSLCPLPRLWPTDISLLWESWPASPGPPGVILGKGLGRSAMGLILKGVVFINFMPCQYKLKFSHSLVG